MADQPDTAPTAPIEDTEDRTDHRAPVSLDDLRGRTPDELTRLVGVIDTRLKALHQDERGALRDLDDAQQREFDQLLEVREQAEARLANHRDVQEVLGRHPAAVEGAYRPGGPGSPGGAPQQLRAVEPFDGAEVRTLTRAEARDRALKVLESRDHNRHLDASQVDQVDRLLRTRTPTCDGGHIGKLLLLTERDDYRTGWQKIVTQANPVLTAEEARAVNEVQEFRAMSGGTDAAGGFGVPILIDPSIILTAQGSLNPFRRLSRIETITTDEWRGVSSAGVTWSYDAEASAVSDDAPTLAQPTVATHEARGFIPYSIRVGQDYPGFADEMSRLLMEGYDELQAQAFATGTGSGQPFGIITALDANTNVEVVVTTDGAFGGVDINKVWTALPDRFKANATWMMNYDVASEIATFANANQWSFFTVDLTGQVEQIRNRPVAFSSYFPDFTGTTGAANILVVGDFRNYLIVDRVGMSVELIPHLFDQATGRPTGQRGWFAYARHGADSVNDLGFRLLQNQ